ncbi:MAG: hypothetical protein H8E46_01600 [FCB group bacterium]|nr:hypothetical protein [FCB group bacterium]
MEKESKVKKVTLDTNCIVSLEINDGNAFYIRELIKLHLEKKTKLGVVAISGSERNRERNYPNNYNEFQKRLENAGLENVDILLPMLYWDICFWDHGLLTNDQMEKLEREIHEILFPNIEYDIKKFCEINNLDLEDKNSPLYQKWINMKCDVQMIWAHIYHKRDIFVTDDDNYRKESKLPALIKLAAGQIFKPKDVLQFLS